MKVAEAIARLQELERAGHAETELFGTLLLDEGCIDLRIESIEIDHTHSEPSVCMLAHNARRTYIDRGVVEAGEFGPVNYVDMTDA